MMNILNRQWQDLLLPGPSFKLRGRISVDVLDARSGIILRHYGPKPNMILNVGKDKPFGYPFANCFLYGHLSVDTAEPIATDAAMAGWVKQTNTYGSGDGATTVSGDVVTLTRSFVFTAETGDVTYTKFYSSPTSGSSASPFNEVLFETPITLASGQQAKVTMSLAVTITPHTTAATYASDVISGISGSTGTCRILGFHTASVYNQYYAHSTITTSGVTGSESSNGTTSWQGLFEPCKAAGRLGVSTYSTLKDVSTNVPIKLASSDVASSVNASLSAYSAGSYERTKTLLADLADCNLSAVKSIYIGGYDQNSGGYYAVFMQLCIGTAFDKRNTQKLSMNFTFTVS